MTTAVSPGSLHPARKPDREDDQNRYYDKVAFASDSYVPWILGSLRLGKADLTRMRTSGCPVLRAHNGDNLVGQVQRVEKAKGIWRSNWRLPKIPANRNTFDQMDTGILRGVSVGGQLDWATLTIDNPDEVDYDKVLWTCDWALVEQSLTPVPNDTSSGIDRALSAVLERDGSLFDSVISPEGIATLETPATLQRLQSLVQQHNEVISALRREEQQTMTTPTISPDMLEKAVNDYLARTEAIKGLAEIPDKLDKLTADVTAEMTRNMETRGKLDSLQFQPNGKVSQMDGWNPTLHQPLNIGRILRLTSEKEMGFPQIDPASSTLEESFLERQELSAPDRSTAARVPFEAIMERSRQRSIQRAALSDAAGARPLQVNVLGSAGLLFNDFSSILAAMDLKLGLRGSQKVPYFTAQGTAAGGAESADIPISAYTMDNTDILPVSIGSAFDLSTSLQAADEGTFEALLDFAIFSVVNDEMVAQVLDGAGSGSNEISGLWGRVSTATPDNAHAYGAAQSDFSRSDILTTKNVVDLAKTDGGPGQWILGTDLYQLAENTLRGGAASERYLLEDMMMESRMVHYFKDFAPSGTDDAGLFAKMDRCCVLVWGDSFQLQEIPVRARKSEWKLVVEANLAVVQPDHNLSSIART